MTQARAISFVLRMEDPTGTGVVVEDPNDPGGITKYGIALKAHPELTADTIRNLTQPQAVAIYVTHYWQPLEGDRLPIWIQTAMLDTAVNQGVGTAIRILQEALRVPVDGVLGLNTSRVLFATPQATVVSRFFSRRIAHYMNDKGWPNYHENWCQRACLSVLDAYV
jgi:lysozyme family protein